MDHLDPDRIRNSPGLRGFQAVSELRSLPVLFPRHLQHVSSRCGRKRKWNGKKITPPPTAATRQGRRAVGREPAGHSRAYLWSAFSSLQSEALGGVTGLSCHTRPGQNTMRREKRSFLLLGCARQPIRLFTRLQRKRDDPVPGTAKDLAASAERFTAAPRAPTSSNARNHGLKPEEGLMDRQ